MYVLLLLITSVVSDSVRPHRRQPTRLPRPWDSPGQNTGVGCHFLLQCMKVKNESEVAQSCPTLSNPMDCSLPGSPIHGIFQARVLHVKVVPLFSTNISDMLNLTNIVRENVSPKSTTEGAMSTAPPEVTSGNIQVQDAKSSFQPI